MLQFIKVFFPVVKLLSRKGLRHEVQLATDRTTLACIAGAGIGRDLCITALKLRLL